MPQFDFSTFIPQIAWLALFFLILYFGIVKATMPKLGRLMDDRENKVNGDIAVAEQAKAEADKVRQDYLAEIAKAHADARAAVLDAQARAVRDTEARLAEANAGLDERQNKAFAALELALSRATLDIETAAADAAGDIVALLSGARPSEADTLVAVRDALVA